MDFKTPEHHAESSAICFIVRLTGFIRWDRQVRVKIICNDRKYIILYTVCSTSTSYEIWLNLIQGLFTGCTSKYTY